MPPSNFKRKWIKLWIDECLTGTVREDLSPEERSVWYDFLLVAGRNRPPGCISANENTPITPRRLASILNIPVPLINRAIRKFKKSGRIEVRSNGIISIINWGKYQFTDYDRQKQYRGKPKSAPEITTYTYEMFEADDEYIESLLAGEDKGKEKTLIYTCTCFQAKYGRDKAAEYWPQYLIYLEGE